MATSRTARSTTGASIGTLILYTRHKLRTRAYVFVHIYVCPECVMCRCACLRATRPAEERIPFCRRTSRGGSLSLSFSRARGEERESRSLAPPSEHPLFHHHHKLACLPACLLLACLRGRGGRGAFMYVFLARARERERERERERILRRRGLFLFCSCADVYVRREREFFLGLRAKGLCCAIVHIYRYITPGVDSAFVED